MIERSAHNASTGWCFFILCGVMSGTSLSHACRRLLDDYIALFWASGVWLYAIINKLYISEFVYRFPRHRWVKGVCVQIICLHNLWYPLSTNIRNMSRARLSFVAHLYCVPIFSLQLNTMGYIKKSFSGWGVLLVWSDRIEINFAISKAQSLDHESTYNLTRVYVLCMGMNSLPNASVRTVI